MKKLMVAMAIAGAVGAVQADLNTTTNDFEAATTGDEKRLDIGNGGGAAEWYISGEGATEEDGTKVYVNDTEIKEYAGDGYSGAAIGNKYLALNGLANVLERYAQLGSTPVSIPADGAIYIDTLVKFTVTEDGEPEVSIGEDKICLWVNASSNLIVTAGRIVDALGTVEVTNHYATTVTFDSESINQWHHLQIIAYPNIDRAWLGDGFVIKIDNEVVGTTTNPFSEGTWVLPDSTLNGYIASSPYKLFPSMVEYGVGGDGTIKSIGFKGSGAIDNLMFSYTDPNPPPAPAIVNFNLTLTKDANVNVVAITTNSEEVTFAEGVAQIPSNTVVSISQPTFAEGYQLASLEINGVAVESPTFPYEFTMEADTTVEIASAQIPTPSEGWVDNPTTEIEPGTTAATAYPGLAGSALATADAQKLTTWAKANSIAYNDIKADTTGAYTEAYLLNCAVADVEDEKEEFKLNITIAADGTPIVTTPDGKEYNGTLQLKGSNDLSTWTPINAASTDYHFYQYELSL